MRLEFSNGTEYSINILTSTLNSKSASGYNFCETTDTQDTLDNDIFMDDGETVNVNFMQVSKNLKIASVDSSDYMQGLNRLDTNNYQISKSILDDNHYISSTQISLLIDSISQFVCENGVSWFDIIDNNKFFQPTTDIIFRKNI